MDNITEGARVIVFDNHLYIDDVKTPLSVTMKPATVVCRYGKHSDLMCNMKRYSYTDFEKIDHNPDHNPKTCCWNYPDLIDVRFDHRPESISKGHFTEGVKEIG